MACGQGGGSGAKKSGMRNGGGGAQIGKRRLLNFYRGSAAVEVGRKPCILEHKKDFSAR
ncbi:hypothetical protein [Dialister sp.]|uniref:hypothetical protein n=1 Tax=Dialister sp. TaxID=1955814 RepID=UPI0025D06F1E|nr:hypothetical protein [Dialister sp.]